MMIERAISFDEAAEIVLRIATPPSDVRTYQIAVISSRRDEKEFQVMKVNLNDPNDRIGKHLGILEGKLKSYIDNPKTIPIETTNAHGRPVARRVKEDIRKERVKQYKRELAVLSGRIMSPITIVDNEGVLECTISSKVGY